jgi:anti-sigma28 factor (negative regulator of flagellin synthesis)
MGSSGESENSVPLLSVTMHKGLRFSKAAQSSGAAAAPAPAKQMTGKEIREARIAEIRAQYLSGSYHVDGRELARKLIDAHLSK